MRTDRIMSVTSEPSVEPVKLGELKTHLRGIGHNDHDEMLEGLIKVARQWVEQVTGRALIQQTRTVSYREWPDGDEIEIPYPPIQSVTSVQYTDTDGDTSTFTDYSVDTESEPGLIVLNYGETWPSATLHEPEYPIVITYVCGYDLASGASSPPTNSNYRENVPENIKSAIKLFAEKLYDRPQKDYNEQLMDTINALLAPYRVWTF